jgi:hypothetical protein
MNYTEIYPQSVPLSYTAPFASKVIHALDLFLFGLFSPWNRYIDSDASTASAPAAASPAYRTLGLLCAIPTPDAGKIPPN